MSEPQETKGADAPLPALVEGLREAERLFLAGEHGGREGAIHALETVVKFLLRVPDVAEKSLQAPLAALLSALMNLDNGARPAMLKPKSSPGRARASALADGAIGSAVFTVNRLRRTGLSAPEAHREVAAIVRETGVTASRGRDRAVTERTVRGWCEAADADIGRHGEVAQTRDGLEACIPALEEHTSPEVARRLYKIGLLDTLRRVRAQDA
jgi:hypothetical protein